MRGKGSAMNRRIWSALLFSFLAAFSLFCSPTNDVGLPCDTDRDCKFPPDLLCREHHCVYAGDGGEKERTSEEAFVERPDSPEKEAIDEREAASALVKITKIEGDSQAFQSIDWNVPANQTLLPKPSNAKEAEHRFALYWILQGEHLDKLRSCTLTLRDDPQKKYLLSFLKDSKGNKNSVT